MRRSLIGCLAAPCHRESGGCLRLPVLPYYAQRVASAAERPDSRDIKLPCLVIGKGRSSVEGRMDAARKEPEHAFVEGGGVIWPCSRLRKEAQILARVDGRRSLCYYPEWVMLPVRGLGRGSGSS